MAPLQQIIEAMVQPLGIVWILSLIGLVANLLKRRWLTAIAFGAIGVLMFVFGSTRVPSSLLARLEKPYAAGGRELRSNGADAVVMLGGMASRSANDVTGMDVSDGFDRFLTAAELLRRNAVLKMLFGGGGNRRIGWSESEALVKWMAEWGIETNRVELLPVLRNTYEEAEHVRKALVRERERERGRGEDQGLRTKDQRLEVGERKEIGGMEPAAERRELSEGARAESGGRRAEVGPQTRKPGILLVTSAYHMRRAEAVFRKAGIDVVPVACDFVGLSDLEAKRPFNPIPRPFGFEKMQLYVHEVIAWWVYRWRGWI